MKQSTIVVLIACAVLATIFIESEAKGFYKTHHQRDNSDNCAIDIDVWPHIFNIN